MRAVLLWAAAAPALAAPPPPHVLFLLVDDLGYASVGFTSPTGEPQTPQIDALAAQGAVLQRHYTYKVCSPTRSSFLSGRLPLHVNQKNHPPCEPGGGVDINMTTIATLLKRAGYATHHAGKWHGGFSQAEKLPVRRGFDSSLAMLAGAAHHFTNVRECGGGDFVDMWLNDAPAHSLNGTYSLYRYVDHAVAVVQGHDASKPLFLYMAFQNVHGPQEAPEQFINMYNASIYQHRRLGLAQISAVDEGIGNLTAAVKAKGMWTGTLVVFSSDNGGPAGEQGNYPLRGSKSAEFEGGVRVVAFVSGGWLPEKMRGGAIPGMMHICDWYATLASLAGLDPTDTEAAAMGLPPIDSVDASAMLTGVNMTGPRTEVPLTWLDGSTAALISGRFKLITGSGGNGAFPGETTPNGTNDKVIVDCGPFMQGACLFDVEADRTEHDDVAGQHPDVVAAMLARLAEIGEGHYQTPGGGTDKASISAAHGYGGFWGPWQPDGLYPTPVPPPPVGGFFLSYGAASTCLRAVSLARGGAAVVGACDGNAHWDMDGGGYIFNPAAQQNEYRYLRQEAKYPSCPAGDTLKLGELTKKNIGVVLNGTRLVLTTCDGLCVAANASLVACADTSAEGWATHAGFAPDAAEL